MNLEYSEKQIVRISDRRLTAKGIAIKRNLSKAIKLRRMSNVIASLYLVASLIFAYNIDTVSTVVWFSFIVLSVASAFPLISIWNSCDRRIAIYSQRFNEERSLYMNTSLR